MDLLGFKNLVLSKNWVHVFASYSKAVETVARSHSYADMTKYLWFSDTFIMYTSNGSFDAYASIEQMARRFVFLLITADIPLRGSISYGEYYADEEQRIHFGKALVEAYEYGESQDWIGLVQCPSAVAKLSETIDVRTQLNYPYWKIPFKAGALGADTELPAYRIGEHRKSNGRNTCLSSLRAMEGRATSDRVKQKYANTIEFIEKNQLRWSSETPKEGVD